MTLIVVLRGENGLVLAADSRGTVGDPRGLTAINDDQTKLFELSRWCGMGVFGSSELAATGVDELKSDLHGDNIEYADGILSKTRALARERYDDWFAKFELSKRPVIGFILAGFHRDEHEELIARTFLVTSQFDFAPQLFPNGNCLAGVPQYATYLMHRFYQPGMNVDNVARLAAYLIAETATQDPKVGGPIHIATITKEEGFRKMGSDLVEGIVRLNSTLSERLREFFVGGGGDGGS